MPFWWENKTEERDLREVFGEDWKPTPSGDMVTWSPECQPLVNILVKTFKNADPSLFTFLSPSEVDPATYPNGGWYIPDYCIETGLRPERPEPGPDVLDHVRALNDARKANNTSGEAYTLEDAIPCGLVESVTVCLPKLIAWLKKCKSIRVSLGDNIHPADKQRWGSTMEYTHGKDEDTVIAEIEQFDMFTLEPCTVAGIEHLVALFLAVLRVSCGKDFRRYTYLSTRGGPEDYVKGDTGIMDLKFIIESLQLNIIKFLYAVMTVRHMARYASVNDFVLAALKNHTRHNRDHRDRLEMYKKHVQAIIDKLYKLANQTDTPMMTVPTLSGSVAEDLKVFTPDEFDYMIDVDYGRDHRDVPEKGEDVKNYREKCVHNYHECAKQLVLESFDIPYLKSIRYNPRPKFPQLILQYFYDPPQAGYQELLVKVDLVL